MGKTKQVTPEEIVIWLGLSGLESGRDAFSIWAAEQINRGARLPDAVNSLAERALHPDEIPKRSILNPPNPTHWSIGWQVYPCDSLGNSVGADKFAGRMLSSGGAQIITDAQSVALQLERSVAQLSDEGKLEPHTNAVELEPGATKKDVQD